MKNLQRFDNILALAFDVKGKILENNISEEAVVCSIYDAVNAEKKSRPSSGIYVTDLEKARYAVYFLIDELFLDMNMYNQNNLAWYNYSLQRKFLESDRGGEIFYTYFEQVLDTLLLTMPIYNNNLEQKISKSQILAENASLSLTEKFRHVIQSASCLDFKNTESEITSKLSMLSTYAQCLLFGFRGKYYNSEYDDMLKELRISAQIFLAISEKDAKKHSHNATQNNTQTLPKDKQKRLSYLFYAACPLVLCIFWYFYCAETVAQIIIPKL